LDPLIKSQRCILAKTRLFATYRAEFCGFRHQYIQGLAASVAKQMPRLKGFRRIGKLPAPSLRKGSLGVEFPQWGGFRSFTATAGNGEVAPKPAIRPRCSERVKPTQIPNWTFGVLNRTSDRCPKATSSGSARPKN